MVSSLFSSVVWMAAGQGPLSAVWQRLTDKTFRGLYQANSFDLAIMLPYFAVLVVLAAYGGHRYWLVYNFFKHRHVSPGPPPEVAVWPKVTIQLPIFNERYVVDRLVDSISRLDYPRDLVEVQLLDDSTDETVEVARACVERYRAMGLDIHYLHRDNRRGFKAGALEEGMKTATGEFIAIFDADFQPHADFLRRTVPYFQDPKIGMIQTRWTYVNRHYSALTEVEAILLDGHFVMEHGGRYREGSFFNFNGTAGVWRRAAIEDAGGWEHDTLTEDTDLSYRAQLRGWKFIYHMDLECPSELPVEMTSFKSQQARWAKGLTQVALKSLPRILRAPIPFHIKMEAFFHLTANISYPLMMLLSTLLLPAMIVRFYQGWLQVLVIDLPLFIASTCSISSFYLMSQRHLYPKSWTRSILYMPFVMALGIGIGVRNSVAVVEALLGIQSEFVRTPKYNIEGNLRENWIAKAYKKRSGWMPWLEVALGLYFAFAVAYSLENENYATVPFLLLFVGGYVYTGAMSLGQGYFERMRLGLSSGETRPAATGAPSF
ncbi:MAG TPA: cellulose synthase family protein [Candidatus Acidoferrales bacterium]|nr:cellulose synthase family protein [Candidatus Acidoferrales bacterium]